MQASLKNSRTTVEILYVEDNPGDALLMKEIFKSSKFPVHLSLARDGEKAIQTLQRAEDFSGKPKPDMILLDINLPGLNGLEVLEKIRQVDHWKDIPVLMMSSSQKDQDLLTAYQNQANFYIVKPMDMKHFAVVMTYIENFWLSRIP